MHEIALAAVTAAAAAVDAAAADRPVSGNGGPPVQRVKGPLDTNPRPPRIQNLPELDWGRIGALRVPPRSSSLSAGQPPTFLACSRAPGATNEI